MKDRTRISSLSHLLITLAALFVILYTFLCTIYITSYASNEVYTLQPYPPSSSVITIQGANPPTRGADIHNLSVSSYNYQVQKVGYRVYTSKWLTGAKKINVYIYNWAFWDHYISATDDEVTVIVFNSKKKRVASKKITIRSSSGKATLSGLSSSSKYYVCFEVPTNGNTYKFDGFISSGD